MKVRKRFLLYYDWENLIQDMSDSDIASLTKWIFKYQNTWEISDMTYWAKLAFAFMRPVFDEDRKDWEETSKTNSKNAKERWNKMRNNTDISGPMRPHTTASEPMRPSTDIGIDSVSGIDTDIIETDTTIVVWEQALENKSDPDINNIIEVIKWQVEFLWLIYKKWSRERERAKNILTWKDFWQVCEKANMSRIEFCKSIIYMSSKLDFWNGKIYNSETLYKHYAQVYNEAVNLKAKKQKDTSLIIF